MVATTSSAVKFGETTTIPRYGLNRSRLVRCAYCGRFNPVGAMHREWRHVGGQEDREEWFCGEGVGHNR